MTSSEIKEEKYKLLLKIYYFFYTDLELYTPRGWGVLPILAYTGRLHLKGVPFSGFMYVKG